ncbi:MAG TPA: corrinoid protein [Planctomycetota bacterium]|jgi:5-methyltetrahydrofolate--homocysteine methyltransferase|nr:corrinoid protein [Planctomycetota bacterium]
MEDLSQLQEAVITGDAAVAREVTEQALAAGHDPLKIVNEYMTPAMDEVGRRFEANEYFVPELLLSARAMKAGLELIRPLLTAGENQSAGRVVIGTAKGDLHDIGKNLVAALLEGAGFEVEDLGVNVDPQAILSAIRENGADIVALSALLTTTMPSMRLTIDTLQEAGLRDQVKVLVGGAPVTQEFADEIGADGYGSNAVAAVELAKRTIAEGR